MAKIFENTRNLNPRRSMFNLSYSKLFDGDLGRLYPVMFDEVVPGDVIMLQAQDVIRFQPMVAPVLHKIDMYIHYFFVPYRLLWNAVTNEELSETGSWEEYITGGFDGLNADVLPTWTPTDVTVGSLWDHFGFPPSLADYSGAIPIDFPRRAYNFTLNEYYIDQNVDTPRALDAETIGFRRWQKDYFTSALPWQQRGTAPALPVSGLTSAEWDTSQFVDATSALTTGVRVPTIGGLTDYLEATGAASIANLEHFFNQNTVDLSTATTFDIADLRLAFQIQRWLERNARSGARYTEFLKSHFGVSPRDERLQRPEYIGGTKSPIIVSEVLQTGETNTTPQGNLAGHGISVNDSFIGKYRVQEYGMILGLFSVMPQAVYQQGIDRQWLRETKYDFFFPEFVNLSEQAILNREIYVTDGDQVTNEDIFGYQGRYDEMRVKRNLVTGQMRDTFDYWHLSRQFTTCPTLNSAFLACGVRKDFLAAPSEPAMIVHHANIIKAFRPLPIIAEPGLIDH